jgi:peptidoglycan hydrolase-like protein with peptidoglycan-binding domain
MPRIYGVILFIGLLVLSGCATTPVINYGAENQQLKTQIDSLEAQINQLKQENAQLKVQLQAQVVSKKEIRMPNAAEIQAALKKAGFYKGSVDGQIGIQTKEAIKKFQEANKINPDGVVGSRTWALLQKYLEERKTQ